MSINWETNKKRHQKHLASLRKRDLLGWWVSENVIRTWRLERWQPTVGDKKGTAWITHCFWSKRTLLKHFLRWQKRFPTLINKPQEENPRAVIGLKKKKHQFVPWEIWTKLLPGLKFIPPKTDQSLRKKYLTVSAVLCFFPLKKGSQQMVFSSNSPSKNTPRCLEGCWCWKKNIEELIKKN